MKMQFSHFQHLFIEDCAMHEGTSRMVAKWRQVLAMTCLSLFFGQATASMFYDDFDSAATMSGGGSYSAAGTGTIASVGGYAGIGPVGNQFSGKYLWVTNGGNPGPAQTFTLTGLSAHDAISLSFLFAALDSWDGDNSTWGPDAFNIKVDGAVLMGGTVPGGFTSLPGVSMIQPVASNLAGNPYYWDSAYSVDTTFAHSASTLTIQFYSSGKGWQGGLDESWALDNLKIQTACVSVQSQCAVPVSAPLPGAMVLLGLFGVVALRKRRS